ncbi:hypothetical protein [Moorena sp. SIO3I6]|uniref:hypothetical protein n=1 Tax=Moorena sp. SIO3I6 TaxID=2607831 RepID=UPI0013F8A84D|nr:hypothetical protein [Moorena sp. SIO3I6]NEP23082.1 hypothetical protein [Moorena sp. SIO3I6]
MEDLSKSIDEALNDRLWRVSHGRSRGSHKNGGTHGTNGSILRRRVKPKPQEKNTREAE